MTRLSSRFLTCSFLLVALPLWLGTRGAPEPAGRAASGPSGSRADRLGLPSAETLAADLLTQFEQIYNTRDGEAYAAMFDPWVFSYRFSPLDKGWGAPDAWDYANEVEVTQRLFADPSVKLLRLRLENETVEPASKSDQLPIDPNGIWSVTARVDLCVRRQFQPDLITTQSIRGHRHQFFFRRGSEDEGRAWRIVFWRDLTGSDS